MEALRARAGKCGTSAEVEHRRILVQALCKPKKKSFAHVLAKIPLVGKDSDFKRVDRDVINELRKGARINENVLRSFRMPTKTIMHFV